MLAHTLLLNGPECVATTAESAFLAVQHPDRGRRGAVYTGQGSVPQRRGETASSYRARDLAVPRAESVSLGWSLKPGPTRLPSKDYVRKRTHVKSKRCHLKSRGKDLQDGLLKSFSFLMFVFGLCLSLLGHFIVPFLRK